MKGIRLVTSAGEYFIKNTMDEVKAIRAACEDESSEMDFTMFTQERGVYAALNLRHL